MCRPVLRLLLIEDNPADARLVRMAVDEGKYDASVSLLTDGEQAIDLVCKSNGGRLPDVILLDWNLPRASGSQVLSCIKSHDRWHSVPVVVLTSSTSADDVQDAYECGASCFVSKPAELDPFFRIIHALERFSYSVWRPQAAAA